MPHPSASIGISSTVTGAHPENPNTTPHLPTDHFLDSTPAIAANPGPDYQQTRYYSLRNFLAAGPADDPNVVYARMAMYPGFFPAPLSNGLPTPQARALDTQPYADKLARQQELEPIQSPSPKCNAGVSHQAPNKPQFQNPGTSPTCISTPSGPTNTHTLRLPEGEDPGFALRKFIDAEPSDDGNTLYGRIASMDSREYLGRIL